MKIPATSVPIAVKESTTFVWNESNEDTKRIIIILVDVIVIHNVPSSHFVKVDSNGGISIGRLTYNKCAVVLDSYSTKGIVPKCMILLFGIENLRIQFWYG